MLFALSEDDRDKYLVHGVSVCWKDGKPRKGEVREMKGSRVLLYIALSLFIPALALLSGCGSSSSEGGAGTGTVSLSLTDATINGVQAVYVTMEEVSVHKGESGSWAVIAEPNRTYNLLELVNGVRENVGIAVLETGHYTQLRMKVGEQPDGGINTLSASHPYGNYVIDNSNEYQELKIPSGYQTGVKVVCGFDINENQTTELILDFDASRSIVEAGSSENLLLKPTIKVLELDEYSIITGTVTDGENGLQGVLVSAQDYDLTAGDDKDRVIVQASTTTDARGSYAIFIVPGTYRIVAYRDNYSPACAEVEALPDSSHTGDFQLVSADTGTISGAVTIANGSEEQHVTINFRQSTQCSGEDKDMELKSVNVLKDGSYSESLPVGNYIVVASTYSETTQSVSKEIEAGVNTVLDFHF
jgi:hypothetical protein